MWGPLWYYNVDWGALRPGPCLGGVSHWLRLHEQLKTKLSAGEFDKRNKPKFDSCNSCWVPAELRDPKLSFVSLIEYIRSKVSFLVAHVNGVVAGAAAAVSQLFWTAAVEWRGCGWHRPRGTAGPPSRILPRRRHQSAQAAASPVMRTTARPLPLTLRHTQTSVNPPSPFSIHT